MVLSDVFSLIAAAHNLFLIVLCSGFLESPPISCWYCCCWLCPCVCVLIYGCIQTSLIKFLNLHKFSHLFIWWLGLCCISTFVHYWRLFPAVALCCCCMECRQFCLRYCWCWSRAWFQYRNITSLFARRQKRIRCWWVWCGVANTCSNLYSCEFLAMVSIWSNRQSSVFGRFY